MVDKSNINPQEAKIVDFDTVLDSLLVDENHVWGKKNKPRKLEPDMFEIMSWKQDDNLKDYKSNNKALLKSSDIVKYKHKINKAANTWKTESQDAFRKFIYSPTKKTAVYQEFDEEMKNKLFVSQKVRPISAETVKIPSNFQAIVSKEGEIIPEEIYFDTLNQKFTSDYIDKYSLKHIENEADLHKELEENAQKQKGKSRILSQSAKKSNTKLISKRLQTKPYKYDKKGQLIGQSEDYFEDIWCEVEDISEHNHHPDHEINENEHIIDGSDIEEKKSDIEDDVDIKRTDYSGVKSKLLSTKYIKKARILDPNEDKVKLDRRKNRIKKFAEQTKFLPNSAFTTYYGKPAFENYGRGNIRPANGGVIYGNYLKTHNVNPHRGSKNPQFKQSYNNALMYGSRLPVCEPELPRKVKEDFRLSPKQVQELKSRNPLFPDENVQKTFENQKIIKPDLINSLRFASEENTPTNSPQLRGMGKSSLSNLQKEQKAIRRKLASKSAKNKKSQSKKSKSVEKNQAKSNILVNLGETAKKSTKNALVETINMTINEKTEKKAYKKEKKLEKSVQTVEKNDQKVVVMAEKDENYKGYDVTFKPKMKLSKKEREKLKEEETQIEKDEKIYPEHEAKINRKFIKSLKEKKAFSNRLAPKVTEVYHPVQTMPIKDNQCVKDKQVNAHKLTVDEMHPPQGYIGNFTSNELNPKYYQHIPAVWLKRIPYAGRQIEKSENIKECIEPRS